MRSGEAGALSVGGDFAVDLQGEGEGGAAGGARDTRRGTVADGVEKVLEFEPEWLDVGQIGVFEREPPRRVGWTLGEGAGGLG